MVAIIYEFNGSQYVSATTYIKLEQENKKLKEKKEKSDSIINKKIIDLHNQVVELLEENKKLKECNSNLMKEVKLCYKELEK